MKKVITNTCDWFIKPSVKKGFKYFILISFSLIILNSAQNNPIKNETIAATTPQQVPKLNSMDSISQAVEANWNSIDNSREDIFNELSQLKQKIKNNKRPIIIVADTVYITDTLMIPRKNLLSFLKKNNH